MSIDERRCKFKPALLQQDIRTAADTKHEEDIKEVFFPGNHGDVVSSFSERSRLTKLLVECVSDRISRVII